MENNDPKNIDFDDVYVSFRLNTVHRYFRGTDSSLLAVFGFFELLHNFREFVLSSNTGKNPFLKNWYKGVFRRIEKNSFDVRPEVWRYVFKRKWMSKKTKNRVLEDAKTELLYLLEETGIRKFIEGILETEHEENI